MHNRWKPFYNQHINNYDILLDLYVLKITKKE